MQIFRAPPQATSQSATASTVEIDPPISGLDAIEVRAGLEEIVTALSGSTIQLSDWGSVYGIGGLVELTENVTIILPDIIAGDLNRVITLKRMDRTAFTVTIQAPSGQTTTMTTPTALNAYDGQITFQVKTLTSSEQVANPTPVPLTTTASSINITPPIPGLDSTEVRAGLAEIVTALSDSTIQLSDWGSVYGIGGLVELTENITIILPDIIAGDLNRVITLKRMDRTAFTVTIQAPTGQTTTMTTPTALNTYDGQITFQVKTLTSSEQVANPTPIFNSVQAAIEGRITLLESRRIIVQTEDDIPNPTGFLTGTQCYVSDTTSTYTVFGTVGQNGLGWAVG
jgi:hypothetical protein